MLCDFDLSLQYLYDLVMAMDTCSLVFKPSAFPDVRKLKLISVTVFKIQLLVDSA